MKRQFGTIFTQCSFCFTFKQDETEPTIYKKRQPEQSNYRTYKLFQQNIFSLHNWYNWKNKHIEIYCFSHAFV